MIFLRGEYVIGVFIFVLGVFWVYLYEKNLLKKVYMVFGFDFGI